MTGATTYVASFYAADGTYGYTDNFFLTPYDAAPLRAPASGNGAYVYAAGGGFPNTPSANATNYFADVAFVGDDHTPPHVADGLAAQRRNGSGSGRLRHGALRRSSRTVERDGCDLPAARRHRRRGPGRRQLRGGDADGHAAAAERAGTLDHLHGRRQGRRRRGA